jgi:RNA recognition motif-containing protein
MTNIFVGNLAYSASEGELEAAFSQFGAVERVSIIRDRDTGQSRGFAFVEMANPGEAQNAIKALNGQVIGGRTVNVNEARPREERGGGFRSNGGGRGFGGRRREPRW